MFHGVTLLGLSPLERKAAPSGGMPLNMAMNMEDSEEALWL